MPLTFPSGGSSGATTPKATNTVSGTLKTDVLVADPVTYITTTSDARFVNTTTDQTIAGVKTFNTILSTSLAVTNIPLTIKGFTGQTSDLFQITRSDNSVGIAFSNGTTSSKLRLRGINTFIDIEQIDSGTDSISLLNPITGNATSQAQFRFFRGTNTTGNVGISIFKGDNTASTNAFLSGNGNTFFSALIGNTGFGTTNPNCKNHTVGGLYVAALSGTITDPGAGNAKIEGSLVVGTTNVITAINSKEPTITTLPINKGGTGLSTAPALNQLLIGNGTSYGLSTLTQGANITITNTAGNITIASTASGHTTTRSTISYTSPVLAPNEKVDFEVNLGKLFYLLSINSTVSSWVRVYPTSAIRTSDAARTIETRNSANYVPTVDVVTTSSALTTILTPFAGVTSMENTPSSNISCSLVNLSNTSGAITLNFIVIILEAGDVIIADQHFNNVVLLMHFNGDNNSTTFIDVKGKTITPTGNVLISTIQSKFGGASGYFDGNGDYLQINQTADFNFETGDFTIEGWIYLEVSENRERSIISKVSENSIEFSLVVDINSKFSFITQTGGSVNGVTTIMPQTWYHFAASRSNGNLRLFLNGNLENSGAISITTYSNPTYIGALDPSNASFAYYFKGYIDELRITKGIARYTANFTPPIESFPNA